MWHSSSPQSVKQLTPCGFRRRGLATENRRRASRKDQAGRREGRQLPSPARDTRVLESGKPIMNSDLEKLLSLQQADQEIARLRQEIASLPRKVAVIEEKLAASRAQVEKARAALKAGEATKRKQEAEIQALQQKISKYREQSLDVKTNEQYRALMHEIGFAEQGIRRAEDSILETMVDAETQERL